MARDNKLVGRKSPGAAKSGSKPVKDMGPSDRETISVRKIENGYIVSKSTDSPKGYKSEEMFSPTRPTFDFKPTKG